jgi:hypothetical protein
MSETNYRETTDHEEVRNWAEERNVVPARQGDSDDIVFVEHGAEADESIDELTWDEFSDQFDRQDVLFRYETGEEGTRYEFVEGEASSETESAEEPARTDIDADLDEGGVLEEGETARSEVTETQTIEKEVTERDVVETEVVDEEVVNEEVIDTELLDRELTGCSLDENGEYVEADLRERKRVTAEVRERDLIESRVVDAEVEETDTVDTDTVDRDVETEGESDLIDDETAEREVAESDISEHEQTDVEAEVADSEVEHGEQIERHIIETEVDEQYHIRAPVEDRDLIDEEVISEEVTDTELLDREGDDMSEDDSAREGNGETRDDDSTRDETADETGEETVHLSQEDEGKDVTDADGEKVGLLTDVEDGEIYIEPDPSFTERLFGSSGSDEDDVVVREEQIKTVGGDEVRLSREGQDELESG